MVIYNTPALYVESATSKKDRLDRICQVIDALELMALNAASGQDVEEYMIDDGQSKIRNRYRSGVDIANSILAFDKIKQRLINELNGRVTRLIDGPSNKC